MNDTENGSVVTEEDTVYTENVYNASMEEDTE